MLERKLDISKLKLQVSVWLHTLVVNVENGNF